MSAPTGQFRRLSLAGDLSVIEAQQHRVDKNSAQMDSSDAGSRSGEDDSTGSSAVQANSGITYDLARLDGDCEARALVGLTGQFEVVGCYKAREGYDFQLSERPRVHIGPDAYTCTCSTYVGHPGVACQHIFWLLDQLHGCFVSRPPASEVTLLNDGGSPDLPRVERLLDGKLEAVAEQLNCPYVLSQSEGGMSRSQKVRDIMSAFNAETLSDEFRLDLVESADHSRTPEQCVVQGDFEATIFRLALHDDAVYSSLCKAMPSGACAAIYFDKVQENSRRLLVEFDHYCQTGQLPEDQISIEVDDVVKQLRRNVNRIQQNIVSRAPHGSEGAAKALVILLEDICNRNKDALDGNRWERVTFDGEDEDQRNLYYQLIGRADETGEFFILETLEKIQPRALDQFGDRLGRILQKVEVNRAPKAYILRLSALVRTVESVSVSTGSGQKRPATATSGGNTTKRSR
ncbi:uncharacterized protein ACLA_006100 [Aspergillus clavatus NRRL 1]|uniref:SWIM-type domain-containing protein n=1 Tax=Aspergillus clavatus (strain ATCC 1007 / CBS 513.65 / DSM 816 / NCTC 3887 / NRRL 1 / QM 1276 / 107) TaxID=344612 RepID=A1CDC6_ASPCL|nr:uncharacterized protein ACLA_006100 [Aspergillus clavatus NRRL 1]EAW11853.1 conserved hypothetical protein [Aspergillus clavatus NRRL 1]